MEKKEDIHKLQLQKAKYRRQNKQTLVAECCNSIGCLYSELGRYQEALEEHEQEFKICDDLDDTLGKAIASRKLGECYMDLGEFEPALSHITQYRTLAESTGNKEEMQRAFVTIGRLHLTQCSSVTHHKKLQSSANKAERAFLKALDITEQLKGKLKTFEYCDMKARVMQNLGTLSDVRGETKEAVSHIEKAIHLARKHNLTEILIISLTTLAQLQIKAQQFTEAKHIITEALSLDKKLGQHGVDLHKLLAQVDAELGEVGKGLENIRTAMKTMSEEDKLELKPTAVNLHKLVKLKQEIPTSSIEAAIKLYEKMGDCCCNLSAYHQGLHNYHKSHELLVKFGVDKEKLTPILSSLGQTYFDIKDYQNSVKYFLEEVKIQKQLQNYEQAVSSMLTVGLCFESMGDGSPEVIRNCYKKTESLTPHVDPKYQLMVQRNYAEAMKLYGYEAQYTQCLRNIREITDKYGISEQSQEETQTTDAEGELSDGGFEMPTKSDDEMEESVVKCLRNNKIFKLHRNELGETKLHTAVIKGHLDKVIELLNSGHPVDVRDNNGWLPIHEAANHNHLEIAKELIDRGANVNDRGGEGCQGCTPLHDACSGGYVEMVQLLLDHSANVIAKDAENKSPLDFLIEYRRRWEGQLDAEEVTSLDEIESLLRSLMMRKGITPKTRPYKETIKTMDEMDSINHLVSKKSSDKENTSPKPASTVTVIEHSPIKSAADMYRSAVAIVRKSAKRAAVPMTSNTLCPAKESALLTDETTPASKDWLIDDTKRSPKRRKLIDQYKRATTPESLSEEVHSSPSRISLSGNSQPVFEADRSEPSTPTALISTPTPLPTTVVEATPEKAVSQASSKLSPLYDDGTTAVNSPHCERFVRSERECVHTAETPSLPTGDIKLLFNELPIKSETSPKPDNIPDGVTKRLDTENPLKKSNQSEQSHTAMSTQLSRSASADHPPVSTKRPCTPSQGGQLTSSTPIRPGPHSVDSGFPSVTTSLRSSMHDASIMDRSTVSTLSSMRAYRILAQCDARILLIPCYETSSVGWLLQEALRRCANRGIERSGPQLLTTVDGAELDSDDLVWDVLRDGEKVMMQRG